MTRVNLIPPFCLYDQHLIAEYREISRIPNLVRKNLQTKNVFEIENTVPDSYVLGSGHVNFFKNKLGFIKKRHDSLREEGKRRGLNLNSIEINLDGIPDRLKGEYTPCLNSIEISRNRIKEKIDLKPTFYQYKK